jgi:hypothetical protein
VFQSPVNKKAAPISFPETEPNDFNGSDSAALLYSTTSIPQTIDPSCAQLTWEISGQFFAASEQSNPFLEEKIDRLDVSFAPLNSVEISSLPGSKDDHDNRVQFNKDEEWTAPEAETEQLLTLSNHSLDPVCWLFQLPS